MKSANMDQAKKVLTIKNIDASANDMECKLGDLIDSVEHMADKYHIKGAIKAINSARRHLKCAKTGIESQIYQERLIKGNI